MDSAKVSSNSDPGDTTDLKQSELSDQQVEEFLQICRSMFGPEPDTNPKPFDRDALRSDQLSDALSLMRREVQLMESNRQAAREALLAAGFLASGTTEFLSERLPKAFMITLAMINNPERFRGAR
ncbi:hypothetical protein FGIG_05004 [Fasciola gigantica]|uniref:Uncharacterized protein n=1 Tax=Fasciola gigantica TaxID=46835 RepID=A0A504Z0U4_FASGI|nr:hypothetical protein FGIG_05004 [Fasciola gigantica]